MMGWVWMRRLFMDRKDQRYRHVCRRYHLLQKTIVLITAILFCAGIPLQGYAINPVIFQNTANYAASTGMMELWVKNGWIAEENVHSDWMQAPVTKSEFAEWTLLLCSATDQSGIPTLDIADSEGPITHSEAVSIASKAFEIHDSLLLSDPLPGQSTANDPLSETEAIHLTDTLTRYEAMVFLEKLRTSPPVISSETQGMNILIKFNKGKGYLNGIPIAHEALVSAVGIHNVTVTDRFGNTSRAAIVKTPAPVVNPLVSYTPAQCMADIDTLKAQYPVLIQSGIIGKSSFGMNIPYVTLGTGKRNILFVGSVHAREHMTTAYLMQMIDTYAAAYYNEQWIDGYDTQKILNETTITFVPLLNPDGVSFVVEGYQNISQAAIKNKFGSIPDKIRWTWKETMTGVNLNRNFPFYWDKNNNASEGFLKKIAGSSAASEPETKALITFCQANRFEFALACHAKGELMYWRDKQNGVINGDYLLAQTIAKATGYRIAKMTTNASLYSGGFENWFRYEYKRPAVCVEFTPHNYSAFPYYNADFHKLIWEKADSLGLAVANLKMPLESQQ